MALVLKATKELHAGRAFVRKEAASGDPERYRAARAWYYAMKASVLKK